MTNKRNGFTLIEATITVAVASILATIAVPQYNIYVAKTQLAESIVLMDSAKPTTVATVVKNGLCTIDGKDQVITGKYGSLVVSGTVNQTAVKNSKVRMDTGCVFTYTAHATGVSKLIAGKTVVADLFNNGTFSKNPATTVDPKLVPKALSLLDQDTAGGKLTPVVPGGPDITNPDDNGGPSTPITPPDPTDPTNPTNPPDPPDPTDPTKPPDPTDPSGEIEIDEKKPDGIACTDTYVPLPGETVILLGNKGSYKTEATHYVRESINLKDTFVAKTGREPKANEKIKFITTCAVAFVGTGTSYYEMIKPGNIFGSQPEYALANRGGSIPAMTVGNWGVPVDLSLLNFGAIVGRGGSGESLNCKSPCSSIGGFGRIPAVQGGTAIAGSDSQVLNVQNYGTITGGGGGGTVGRGGNNRGGGGGGAPYGDPGAGYNRYDPALEGQFSVGGRGAHAGDRRYGGWGAGWGDYGNTGDSGAVRNRGKPGFVKTGLVNIENFEQGLTKGM